MVNENGVSQHSKIGHSCTRRVKLRHGKQVRATPQSRHALTRLARQFRAKRRQDYSITSSATVNILSEMVRPSAIAVVRLINSS